MRSPFQPATALATSLLFLVPGTALAQPAPHDWSGLYAGLTAGVMRSDTRLDFDYSIFGESPPDLPLPRLSGSGGVVLGVNFQQGKFVYGLQADGSLMMLHGHQAQPGSLVDDTPTIDVDAQLDALLNLRGRFGLANGPLLFFTTAGVALAHETFDTTIFDNDGSGDLAELRTAHANGIAFGPTLGMGVEYAVNDNVSITAEGTIASLGGLTATGDNGKGAYTARSTAPILGAKAGINFHF